MYEWSWGIFAKKSEIHNAGGPDTVVSPTVLYMGSTGLALGGPGSDVCLLKIKKIEKYKLGMKKLWTWFMISRIW